MKLRDYQTEAVDAVIQSFRHGKRPLVELPTGSGKTVVFAELTRRLKSGRALVLVHRKELKAQAEEKIRAANPDCEVDVRMVQTVSRRLHIDYKAATYSLIIIDEAHHASANSYDAILNYFVCKCVVGFTATAYREQGGRYTEAALISDTGPFHEMAYQRGISEMIDEGYLVRPRAIRIETHTNLTGTKTQAGDYAPGALDAVINNEARNQLIAEKWREYAGDIPTIVFGITVEHAQNIAYEMNRIVPDIRLRALCVHGKTPIKERESIVRHYKAGVYTAMTGVGVFTEGFDAPATACIIMARPTKSPILFTQCIGRGLRPSPGKSECLVLDFADVAGRHRLDDIHIGDVMPGAEELREAKGSKTDDPDRLEPMPPPEEIIKETTAKEVELLDPNRVPSHRLKAFLEGRDVWRDGMTHAEAVKANRIERWKMKQALTGAGV